MTRQTLAIAGVTMCALATPSFAQSSTNVGFDGGSDGGFIGNAFFEATGGNPDGNAHHLLTAFFLALRTGGIAEPTNPNFLGDYSSFGEVTFGIDVRVALLNDFIGNPIVRPIGVALIDRDIQGPDGPSGIFYTLGYLSAAGQPDWTPMSVTIDDPTSATLPAGWIGFGDTDPMTFEPRLPAGATFATVLASVDEFHVSGAVPGFFFNDAIFDVRIDNISLDLPSDTIGKSYCGPGVPNSTGKPGVLTAAGSTVAADEDVTLMASDLPPGNVCLFIASTNQGFIQPPRSCGPICLMGPDLARFKFDASVVDNDGNCSLVIDPFIVLTNPPQPILAGQTWNFQAWHRDSGAGPDCNNNFTDAVEITLE